MAQGTLTSYVTNSGRTEQTWVATSAANTAQTVSTNAVGAKRIRQVTVKYSAGASVTATCTLNAVAGAGYDTLLQSIPLAGATDGVWVPDYEVILQDGDALDVLAPAGGSGVTSSVQIYTEAY